MSSSVIRTQDFPCRADSARRSPRRAHGTCAFGMQRRRPGNRSQSGYDAAQSADVFRSAACRPRTCRHFASTCGRTSRRRIAAASATPSPARRPMFARPDDVNLAYDAANTVVDLTDPFAVAHGC